MKFGLGMIRNLVFDLPKQGKLAYCLLRDERVPRVRKLALLGVGGLIVSPLDLPAWVPVVGELDVLALGMLALKVFIDTAPEPLVREHRQALEAGDSRFDRDLGGLKAGFTARLSGLLSRRRGLRS